MANIVTFDPIDLRIIEIDMSLSENILSWQEIQSEWKDWLIADPSRLGYPQAFSQVGGDTTIGSDALGVTQFLENGWRMRPAEYNHKLTITGNCFARGGGSVFVSTLGTFNVHTETLVTNIIDRVTTGAGSEQATIQAALTAQGYTTTRAPKIDNLDVAVSTRSIPADGLTSDQTTMLLEMYRLLGLDPTKPLVVTPTTRKVPANGADISQTITEVGSDVTVQRV